MLKIKDSVDLKELEKYCFKKNGVNEKTYIKQNGDKIFESNLVVSRDSSRMIYFSTNSGSSWLPIDDVLFDLIQAGLVEKVGDSCQRN